MNGLIMVDNTARKLPMLLQATAADLTRPAEQTAALLKQPSYPIGQAALHKDLLEKTLAVYQAVRAYGYKEKNIKRTLGKFTTPQLLHFGSSVNFGLRQWAGANEKLPQTFFETPVFQNFVTAHTALAAYEHKKWARYAQHKQPARPDSFFVAAGADGPRSIN